MSEARRPSFTRRDGCFALQHGRSRLSQAGSLRRGDRSVQYPNPPLPAEPGRFRQVTDTAWRGRIYKLSLDGKLLGMPGRSGKQLKQFGWIHALACPSENVLWVGELLNWRAQKLVLHP